VKLGHRIKIGNLKDIRDSLEILSHTLRRGSIESSKLHLQLLIID